MVTEQTLRSTRKARVKPIENQHRPKWEKQFSPHVLRFIKKWVNPENNSNLILLTDAGLSDFSPPKNSNGNGQAIANHAISLKRLNEISHLNLYLRSVNENIEMGGRFIGRLETSYLRKMRILARYPWLLNRVIYLFDYLIFRVWPKMPYFRHLYFWLFGNRSRAIPAMEALGRLHFFGFSLLGAMMTDDEIYFAVKKNRSPEYDRKPNSGPVIRLRRKGENGKIIHVYKLRTMFAYAEFLQQKVYERHGLASGGKIKKDPRVNAVGFILRKYWLDELPMIANLLKGDLKIVGVRPLSKQYLGLYPKEVQEYREKFKPGLIPPFYADMPKTLDEIVASEMHYLQAYERQPFLTDLRFFCKVFYNIVFRMARSK
jgi:lipopolysaccharide/colanic/teichoic acid biosynthesis glycosyltransferase